MKNNKLFSALLMGMAIGITIGSITTYFLMKIGASKQIEKYEDENLSITEKLTLEIKKLTLKNTTYNFVDTIESTITSLKETDDKYVIVAGMYMLKEEDVLKQVDETSLEIIENGALISNIDFKDEKPNLDSMVYINEKGKVSEAVFYVDEFQITYDLVGTKVTQIEK